MHMVDIVILEYIARCLSYIKQFPNVTENEYNFVYNRLIQHISTTCDYIFLRFINLTHNKSHSFEEYPLIHVDWDYYLLSRNKSLTYTFLLTNPSKHWDYDYISIYTHHVNDVICQYPYKNWKWNLISENPCLTKKTLDIGIHLGKTWNWQAISKTKSLTIELLNTYRYQPWNWYEVSMNAQIDMIDVMAYDELPWDFNGLSNNPNVTVAVLLHFYDKPWNWRNLSRNSCLDNDMLLLFSVKPWDWDLISNNPRCSLEILKDHPHTCFDWKAIAQKNIYIMDILEFYSNFDWDWYHVLRNPHIDILDVLELICYEIGDTMPRMNNSHLYQDEISYIDEYTLFYILSSSKLLTPYILHRYRHKPWNWYVLSKNNVIDSDFLYCYCKCATDHAAHMEWGTENSVAYDWNWNELSQRPLITIECIVAHGEKPWNWDLLISRNLFNANECIEEWCCKYSVLSMHDEDYGRGKESLDYEKALDVVIHNEYCILHILGYL